MLYVLGRAPEDWSKPTGAIAVRKMLVKLSPYLSLCISQFSLSQFFLPLILVISPFSQAHPLTLKSLSLHGDNVIEEF